MGRRCRVQKPGKRYREQGQEGICQRTVPPHPTHLPLVLTICFRIYYVQTSTSDSWQVPESRRELGKWSEKTNRGYRASMFADPASRPIDSLVAPRSLGHFFSHHGRRMHRKHACLRWPLHSRSASKSGGAHDLISGTSYRLCKRLR